MTVVEKSSESPPELGDLGGYATSQIHSNHSPVSVIAPLDSEKRRGHDPLVVPESGEPAVRSPTPLHSAFLLPVPALTLTLPTQLNLVVILLELGTAISRTKGEHPWGDRDQ